MAIMSETIESFNSTEVPFFTNEINSSEVKLLEVVGKGTFGVVRRALWRGRVVAVKTIDTENEKKAFQIELRQLSRVSHPNIVGLFGAIQDNGFVALVMEYAEGGSLHNVLHLEPLVSYTLSHAISWVLQCARGVSYLHAMQPKALVHRDLKPLNLLLVNGGTVLKICDFGTACDIHTHMTNNKGSAAWMAPEVFESSNYTEKCDVFSWGIILWEVLARKKPYDEIGGPAFRVMWAIHSGQRPPLIRNCPEVIETLMTRCWDKDPNIRPSMTEVEQTVEQVFEFCSEHANEPIMTIPSHSSAYSTGAYSMYTTNCSVDQQIQTQFGPQQIETEPPVLNMSGTNIDPNVQTKDSPAFSVPTNLCLISNSNYNDSEYIRNRKSSLSRIQRPIIESNAIPVPAVRGHKRSSSSGTPVSLTNTSQPLNKSHSILGLNDDQKVVPNSPQELHGAVGPPVSRRPELSLVVPSYSEMPSIPRIEPSVQFPDDFNAYLVLEPELQPIQPDTNSRESIKIFEEHKRLSQEFLAMKMETTLLMSRKQELETKPNVTTSLEDYMALKNENQSLLQFKDTLKTQLDLLKRRQRLTTTTADGDSDGWVLVDRSETQNVNQNLS